MKFKPLRENATVGEKYRPAMEITDPSDAHDYFEMLVQHNMSHGITRQRAEEIERRNLGYYAGYFSGEAQERVQRLFSCSHPVFGKKIPTHDEAFEAGRKIGIERNEG